DADSDGDTESDNGSVSRKSKRRRPSSEKKQNRIRRTSSPLEPLMVPKDDEQAELMFQLYHKAREFERLLKKENMRIKEIINLTLLDLADAASCLAKGKPVSEAIRRKCEKEKYGLYGITVRRAGADGGTIPGTKVTSGKGRTGEVVRGQMEKGYNEFTIEWSSGNENKCSAYTTEDVLRDRDDNQGVVTLNEAKEKIRVFLLAALCMVNVQVHKFITNDVKVENINGTCPLTGAKAADIIQGRKHAWDNTKQACAVDMLMENEVNLLYSDEDEGLLAEMNKERSCFKMMGLDDYERIGKTGLMGSTEDFNSKHLPFVNHFVRGIQASFRLGRPTNLASSTIHLSVNELP
ncbi:unnamed protein product, partial [Laminaria digitata]